MAQTNCINCGAAIDIDAGKCPFCGTSYYDFTNIDLNSKPVALKFRLNDMIFSCLSIPSLKEIYFNSTYEASIDIEFSAIMKNDALFTIQKEIQMR